MLYFFVDNLCDVLIISLYISYFLLQLAHLFFLQYSFIFDRYYLDKFVHIAIPVIQHRPCQFGAGIEVMLADQFMQFLPVRCLLDKRELHHLHVAEIIEVVVLVPHVSHAATHSGSEITSGFSQYHDPSSGHVFATVVAYTLYHGLHTGIADGEAFAHPSVDIYLAVSSAIQQGVSGDGILFRIEIAAHGGSTAMRPPLSPFPR